jgi:hypothetical protein
VALAVQQADQARAVAADRVLLLAQVARVEMLVLAIIPVVVVVDGAALVVTQIL